MGARGLKGITGKAHILAHTIRKHLGRTLSWGRDAWFRRRCRDHLRRLAAEGEVLVGPVVSFRGGTRHHMLAIRRHSSLPVRTFPTDAFLHELKDSGRLDDFAAALRGEDLNRFRVVHSHASRWLPALCAGTMERRFGWVHTYHTLYFEDQWAGGLRQWQKQINRVLLEDAPRADVRISISRWLQHHLEQEHGITTVWVPNGVEVEKCEQADGSRFEQREGLSGFVLYLGNILEVKDPGRFVRLAAALPDRQFVMIGQGLSAANIAGRLGLEAPENLSCHDEMPHAEALEALAACRAFVVTSRSEGLPTALMEAMAMGKPVVAPDCYGCAEVVQSPACGRLYAPDSFDALVAAIEEALAGPEVAPEARERIRQQYDWRVIGPRLGEIYRDIAR